MRISQFSLALAASYLCACSTVRLTVVDPADSLREFRQDIISSSNLSPLSLQAVRMAGLTQDDVLENGVDASVARQFEHFADSIDKAYIESEVAIGRAQLLEKKQPEKAIALYLHAADMAYQGFFLKECAHPVDVRCDSFKVFYDRAVRGVLSYLSGRKWNTEAIPVFDTGIGRSFSLAVAEGANVEDPKEYASIDPASSIGLEGLTNRHRRAGFGVSLVACRKRRDGDRLEEYLPRVGTCLPLTAIVRFPDKGCQGAQCAATFELINSVTTETYQTAHGVLPLAADFTAPLAAVVQNTGMGGWDGLFDAIQGNEELLKNTGFYTLEPFESGKIPLVTVHGLFSNPLTWLDVHNELMGDPAIRKHFRVWHYLYPTNLPILENAKTFRQKLDELQGYLESQSAGRSIDRGMVVVGHSMGGLLTRTAVVDSAPLMDFFMEDPKRLSKLSKDAQDAVRAYVDFKPKPYIDRVVFVAVPHRGSSIADNWIGSIGRWLLSLPKAIVQKTVYVAREARNVLRPDLQTAFDAGQATSIQGLSEKSPALQGLSKTTIAGTIPFHSIIGDRGRGDTPESSDGVVAYRSSHVEGAQSELIVPADHTAHAHPQALLEIRRILRLHVDHNTAQTSGSGKTARVKR
ncbi:MAG: esterase/lipase family protein [Pseudomonadota bacterium]|jgi:pimeloyl-ACP methyl ester carboxylesterase